MLSFQVLTIIQPQSMLRQEGKSDKMKRLRFFFRHISPFQTITCSFLILILLGSILLMLPAAGSGEGRCSYLDALFTASSAVCVTGLVVHNTATYWSGFGQGIILLLIQIGGLGVITVVIAASIFSGKRIGLRQRNLMQNAVNAPKLGGIIRFTRFLLFFTAAAEICGALLLIPVFAKNYGLAAGTGKAFFHSISAFCNAGFDILSDKTPYASLTAYRSNVLLNVVIICLIVAGGLGFLTWDDLISKRFRFKKLTLQTKLVLLTSAILIVLPALFLFLTDFTKGSPGDRILFSVFQSVTTRTAGFNTVSFDNMREGSHLLMIILMLIGGSPGSTAGGMKTTTLAIIMIAFRRYIRQDKDYSSFGRSVSSRTVLEAFTLLMLYLGLFLGGSLLISTIEHLPVIDCMFESASALGTVGLTTGITPSLGSISKIVLILFMYFGRVGGLTLAYAALGGEKADTGRLPEEKVMIG